MNMMMTVMLILMMRIDDYELPTSLRVVVVLYLLFLFAIGISTTYVTHFDFEDSMRKLQYLAFLLLDHW